MISLFSINILKKQRLLIHGTSQRFYVINGERKPFFCSEKDDEKLFLNGKYPLIQTGNVTNSNLYLSKHKICYNDFGLLQSKLWDKGTLCITIAANIAETAILSYPMCFPDSVVGFSAYPKKTSEIFMHYIFTFIKKSLQEMGLMPHATFVEIDAGVENKTKVGQFEVEFFSVNHSIPDCAGLFIESPGGAKFVHTGDFKIDHTPRLDKPADFERYEEIGNRGVTMLLSDSTGSLTKGFSMSEKEKWQKKISLTYWLLCKFLV